MEFTKQLFTYNDISIEVNISLEDKSIWLSQKDMGILFGKARPTISRTIKKIYDENILDKGSTFSKYAPTFAKNEKVETASNNIFLNIYSLPLILEVGRRLKSPIVSIFESWCNDILNPQIIEQPSNIIKFDNGMISLDVRVEPDEETVWLTKDQLVILFATTRQNIEYHLNNIYDSGELEKGATCKEILQVQIEGGREVSRYIEIYNLDVVIYLGFKIDSVRGIEFRKWAFRVLKQYVNDEQFKGEKTDFALVQLFSKTQMLEDRVAVIEDKIIPKGILVFENHEFDAIVIMDFLILSAMESIVLIDPYTDTYTLNMMRYKKENVSLFIITSGHGCRITDIDKKAFNEQYGGLKIQRTDMFHDRFLIIDKRLFYQMGSSAYRFGHHVTRISFVSDEKTKEGILRMIDAFDGN